jgi:hypothetical protein
MLYLLLFERKRGGKKGKKHPGGFFTGQTRPIGCAMSRFS